MNSHVSATEREIYKSLPAHLNGMAWDIEYRVFGIGKLIGDGRNRSRGDPPLKTKIKKTRDDLFAFEGALREAAQLSVLIAERLSHLKETLKAYYSWVTGKVDRILIGSRRAANGAAAENEASRPRTLATRIYPKKLQALRPSSYVGWKKYQDDQDNWFWPLMLDVWVHFLSIVGIADSLIDTMYTYLP